MSTYIITDYGVVPDDSALQTEKIQAVLDLCKTGGGTVVIPAGTYRIASLWMWSDTTLYLQSGVTLQGSTEIDDYRLFPIPEGVQWCSDLEVIPEYYKEIRPEFNRGMISVYGQKNISIIGEPGSLIDGMNCYDPEGEEGYRGPHIITLEDCENVILRGYTAANAGDFQHETGNCRNLVMENVTCLGGSDGIHLHCSQNVRIESCDMQTGDDCVAGCNVRNLTVRNCKLNTACSPFRIGGVNILVEDCHIYGPGIYPHRMTVVQGKNKELPREAGRHNTVNLVEFFASKVYPNPVPCDITFRNCLIEGIDRLLFYKHGSYIQTGQNFTEWNFENVTIRNIKTASTTVADPAQPLYIRLHNVTVEGCSFADLMDKTDPNTHIVSY